SRLVPAQRGVEDAGEIGVAGRIEVTVEAVVVVSTKLCAGRNTLRDLRQRLTYRGFADCAKLFRCVLQRMNDDDLDSKSIPVRQPGKLAECGGGRRGRRVEFGLFGTRVETLFQAACCDDHYALGYLEIHHRALKSSHCLGDGQRESGA